MSVYCTLFSQTFYGLLFCYLTITDLHVTLYLHIIDFQFPSCCTSQPPKKLDQIITVNSSTNTPRSYHQKNNSCTLCVPMFMKSRKLNRAMYNDCFGSSDKRIGLITVYGTILTGRQSGQKLQCLYGNPTVNNFF